MLMIILESTTRSSGIEGRIRNHDDGVKPVESKGKFSVCWGACYQEFVHLLMTVGNDW